MKSCGWASQRRVERKLVVKPECLWVAVVTPRKSVLLYIVKYIGTNNYQFLLQHVYIFKSMKKKEKKIFTNDQICKEGKQSLQERHSSQAFAGKTAREPPTTPWDVSGDTGRVWRRKALKRNKLFCLFYKWRAGISAAACWKMLICRICPTFYWEKSTLRHRVPAYGFKSSSSRANF